MEATKKRISKDEYYLNIAYAVAQRSPCLRRKVGAIIVKNDVILSTGYNGPPRKTINCDEVGCLKDAVNAPHASGWEWCPAVHAEENSIINAARQGVSILGGTMYIAGEYLVDAPLDAAEPCDRCKKAIINAGIKEVVIRRTDGSIKRYDVKRWIEREKRDYLEKMEKAKRGEIKFQRE